MAKRRPSRLQTDTGAKSLKQQIATRVALGGVLERCLGARCSRYPPTRRASRDAKRGPGLRSPLSQRRQLSSSTPVCAAANAIVRPSRLRYASSLPGRSSARGQGSPPRKSTIAGNLVTAGLCASRSHHISVFGSTPSDAAASFTRKPEVRRLARSRCPSVAAAGRMHSGRRPLRTSDSGESSANKMATRP